MKKALKALVVAIAVVFSFAAWADDVKTVDGVTYTYEIVAVFGNPSAPPEARIKGVNLNGKSQIAVPEALDGKPVTSIASSAFENKTGLRVVELPASLTTIWDSAFKDCTSLESVIGGGLTDIHNYAFHGCSSLIDTPDDFSGLKTVGRQAFYGCSSLEEICLPDSLNALGDGAFENCSSLQNAYLPAFFAYSDLRDRYFKGCPAGLNVFSRASVAGTAWNFKFVDGGVELCFDVFLWGPTIDYDTAGHVEIPGELCNRSVVSIGKNAFEFCADITSMTIPASVTKIEKWALEDTSLETVYVDKGDADRVRGLLEASGYDVGEVAFLDGSEDEVVPVEATWYTTRAEAFAAARKTGKKVFMICGRDTCGNTMYTKNYSSEQPKVKSELVAKCVLWYSNCDTQFDENYYYWPNGTFTLPLVCVIDPDNDKGFIVRRTGPLDPEDIIAMLVGIPYPAMDDYANLDPFYPGEMPGYKVVNPADIWDPIQAPKAVVLHGALYYGNGVEGVIELKVGKLKNYQAKVSGTATLLDGKKYTVKSKKCDFGDKLASVLNLDIKGGGSMRVAIGSMGGVNVFSGSFDKWHVQTANVGGSWDRSTATVKVTPGSLPSGILDAFLPASEVATVSGGKWKFEKAASVKWTTPKNGMLPVIYDADSGKGLVVDTSKGTNLSGLKLTYTPKKGIFKGSFKMYELNGSGSATKLKKHTVSVNGVVVDGVGRGKATCKNPVVSWPVTVE